MTTDDQSNSNTDKTIRVAIADDHKLFRDGIRSILEAIDGVKLVAEAGNGQELLQRMNWEPAHVVLLDLEMAGLNGQETFKKIQDDYAGTKVIILSMHSEERIIVHMLEQGVNAYLTKDTERRELEEAIVQVHEKGYYFSDVSSRALLSGVKNRHKKPPVIGKNISLTSRELEVLELIAQQHTNAEIADKLFIATKTVEGHRKNLISKFNVRNTAGLLVRAIKEQIIHV